MRIQIKCQITVNAPASKTWNAVAHEFENIDQWASGVAKSKATTDGVISEGTKVSGRFCSSQNPAFGIDEVREELIYYDEMSMRLGYKAHGLPSFFRCVKNTWSVIPLGSNKSSIEIKPDIDVSFFPGLLLNVLRIPLSKTLGDWTLEELKYYIEHNQPHPRKLKAQQKK